MSLLSRDHDLQMIFRVTKFELTIVDWDGHLSSPWYILTCFNESAKDMKIVKYRVNEGPMEM